MYSYDELWYAKSQRFISVGPDLMKEEKYYFIWKFNKKWDKVFASFLWRIPVIL